jgi:hypothetical protein
LDFLLVFFDVVTTDYVAEQCARRDIEYALVRIQLPLELIEGHEGLVEIVNETSGRLSLNYYIVNVRLNELISDLIFEASLDGMLISGSRVLEPKRHSRVAIGAEGRDEGCLNLVFSSQRDLVITRIAI